MDRFPYPQGSVVAVLDDAAAVEDARTRLSEAGFGVARVEVLQGDEGLARIDERGDLHGHKGSIMRRLQSVFSDDADHVRRYVEELRDGHYVLGVDVGDDALAKERAAEALRAARPSALDFYAENYVEDLVANA